jgi:branched-chain amino acid transport system substrate-binding protein
MLPVAEEYKKILLVEPAVADSITGDKWNKYIFRTGRNSSQDAISNAVALDKPATHRHAGQDNAFGRTASRPSRVRSRRPRSSTRSTCPCGHRPTSPPPAAHHRQAQGQAGQEGGVDHLGRRQPVQDRRPGPEALRHRDRHRRQHPAGDGGLQAVPRHGRRAYYYFGIPKNPVNEWLVANHYKQFKRRPTSSPPAA